MKSFLTLLSNWVIIGCFLCCSCTHYYYAPEDGNLLALNEKGDLRASASVGIGLSEYESGIYSFQAGYSPANKFGIQAQYFRLKSYANREVLGKIYIASAAAGFYHFIDFENANKSASPKHNKQGILFDAYLGGGIGQVHNYYFGGGESNFTFNKTYLQGGFHWQGKYVGISVTGRLVRLDYDKGVLSGNIEDWEWDTIDRITNFNPYTFLETSSRFHVGSKHLKFFVSHATVFPDFYDSNVEFLHESFQIGIFADIDSFFDKKSKSKKKKYSSKK